MTIPNITPDKFKMLEQKMSQNHDATMTINSDGKTGTISGHMVTANFTYDEVSDRLTIDITKHPWFLSIGRIETEIGENISKALNG